MAVTAVTPPWVTVSNWRVTGTGGAPGGTLGVTTTLLPTAVTIGAMTASCKCAVPVLDAFDAEIVTSKMPV